MEYQHQWEPDERAIDVYPTVCGTLELDCRTKDDVEEKVKRDEDAAAAELGDEGHYARAAKINMQLDGRKLEQTHK
jgi:hypothetical protein